MRQYELTARYLEATSKTVVTSLRGQGVSFEVWLELSEPPHWGVRVRAGGKTYRLGDEIGPPLIPNLS